MPTRRGGSTGKDGVARASRHRQGERGVDGDIAVVKRWVGRGEQRLTRERMKRTKRKKRKRNIRA